MSTEVRLSVDEDGQQTASTVASFDLGKVHQALDTKKEGKKTIVMRLECEHMMGLLKMSMNHAVQQNDSKGFDNALEEYCKMWMLDKLGLKTYPLQFSEDGAIDGFKGDYTIVQDYEQGESLLRKEGS